MKQVLNSVRITKYFLTEEGSINITNRRFAKFVIATETLYLERLVLRNFAHCLKGQTLFRTISAGGNALRELTKIKQKEAAKKEIRFYKIYKMKVVARVALGC